MRAPKPPSSERPRFGAFRLDGSYDPQGDAAQPLTQFLLRLARERREKDLSPAAAANRLKVAGWGRALGEPTLNDWARHATGDAWSRVYVETSAGEFLKRGAA